MNIFKRRVKQLPAAADRRTAEELVAVINSMQDDINRELDLIKARIEKLEQEE